MSKEQTDKAYQILDALLIDKSTDYKFIEDYLTNTINSLINIEDKPTLVDIQKAHQMPVFIGKIDNDTTNTFIVITAPSAFSHPDECQGYIGNPLSEEGMKKTTVSKVAHWKHSGQVLSGFNIDVNGTIYSAVIPRRINKDYTEEISFDEKNFNYPSRPIISKGKNHYKLDAHFVGNTPFPCKYEKLSRKPHEYIELALTIPSLN